jgi:hypothetical protein
VFPPYGCWSSSAEYDAMSPLQREIDFLAARRWLRTNGGHTARAVLDCAAEKPKTDAVLHGALEERHLYVFIAPLFDEDVAKVARCGRFAGGVACSTSWATVPAGFEPLR